MNKNLKIILGIFFIVLGVFLTLDILNITFISFSGFMYCLGKIWPIILIIFGVYFITSNNKIRLFTLILSLLILVAGSVVYTNSSKSHYNNRDFDFDQRNYNDYNFFNEQ